MKNMNIINGYVAKSPIGGFRGLLLYVALQVPLWGGLGGLLTSCGDWLDVVPEGVATIDMAFNSREQTLHYLATCYSYMNESGSLNDDPAMLGAGEFWTDITMTSNYNFDVQGIFLAQGMQSATVPLFGYWSRWYLALRDCNIFLENIGSVPDMLDMERDQWAAEVKFLKAWYHFCLVRAYGPVPLVRENIPISSDISKVKVVREPVDDCFQYIVELLDEATEGDLLPMQVMDIAAELGRITKPIALALKAKVLLTAASPLFNGNDEQATLRNRDGTQLFNVAYDASKWEKAAVACREAIEACRRADIELYEFPNTGVNKLTDTIVTQMSLRNAFTLRWNSEIIWANTQSIVRGANLKDGRQLQMYSGCKLDTEWRDATAYMGLGVTLNTADMFYTEHGIPLSEDKTRDNDALYNLRTAKTAEKLYVKEGTATVDIHFDREPRFYAWVGFDNGIWYGHGVTDDQAVLWHQSSKADGVDRAIMGTGNNAKKFVPYTNMFTSMTNYSYTPYAWPMIRLSDLYLMYAEALNESEELTGAGNDEMFFYIDEVRKRAGLEGVKESWGAYSSRPTKYNSKEGMREIIQHERMIELCFEGQRFWDVRRWKTAPEMYRTPIDGWNTNASDPAAFYTPRVLTDMKFGIRDYFWPVRNSDISVNPNLVQNIGW